MYLKDHFQYFLMERVAIASIKRMEHNTSCGFSLPEWPGDIYVASI